MNMRKRIFEIIELSHDHDRASAWYDGVMVVLIVLSMVPLGFKEELPVLNVIDKGCAAVFLLDYALRWATADYKFGDRSVMSFVRYPFSPMAIVDLLSILPSFALANSSLKALRVIRFLRAMRVLRVLKASRYSRSVQIILRVLRRSKAALGAVCSLAAVYILVSALVMFNVEPDSFGNLYDAIYWATVSLTTVGYGDLYPVTALGRAVAMLSSIFGIAVVALPAGIITAGYMEELQAARQEKKNELPE